MIVFWHPPRYKMDDDDEEQVPEVGEVLLEVVPLLLHLPHLLPVIIHIIYTNIKTKWIWQPERGKNLQDFYTYV